MLKNGLNFKDGKFENEKGKNNFTIQGCVINSSEMSEKVWTAEVLSQTKIRVSVQCNLDLVTLLVSAKTVKLHNVAKSNDFL